MVMGNVLKRIGYALDQVVLTDHSRHGGKSPWVCFVRILAWMSEWYLFITPYVYIRMLDLGIKSAFISINPVSAKQ
jgi:hypothetical protein